MKVNSLNDQNSTILTALRRFITQDRASQSSNTFVEITPWDLVGFYAVNLLGERIFR